MIHDLVIIEIDSIGRHDSIEESATPVEIESVLAKSLVQAAKFDLAIIHSEKEQIIRKSGTLEFLHPDASFGGVGGLPLLKTWLRKRAKAFTPEARAYYEFERLWADTERVDWPAAPAA